MSYIPEKYTLTIQIKEGVSWDSDDTDYVWSRLTGFKYELEKLVGEKFQIKVESDY